MLIKCDDNREIYFVFCFLHEKKKPTIVDIAVEALGHHQCVACPAVKCHGVFIFSLKEKRRNFDTQGKYLDPMELC